MTLIPGSNISGLPKITAEDLKNNDPARLNRTLRLLATQIQSIQTGKPSSTSITNATTIVEESGTSGGGSSGGTPTTPEVVTIQGTHAERLSIYLAPSEPLGSFYYETDRNVLYLNYLNNGVNVWLYVSGIFYGSLGSIPTDLGQLDVGFIFCDNVTYYRAWVWGGTGWTYNVGQPPYAAIQLGMVNTPDPGWALCNGATITITTALAGTTTVATPNPYGYFLEAGTYTGTQVAAVKSTINSYTPTGSVESTLAGEAAGTFVGTPETFTTANFVTLSGTTPALTGPSIVTPSGEVGINLSGAGVLSGFAGNPATLTVNTEGAPPYMAFPVFVKL